ncbi:MAG: hypothetical protein M1814_006711 [Vezdaea aestivalis]|nr:MAG: hypothetical protein M1814_006711 [Vezdaea aestivalis]
MAVGGAFLRISQTGLRIIQFLASALILGVFAYFLAVFSDRNVDSPRWVRAVTGISGAACLYTIFAILLTCCLGGVMFFAFLAIVLDVAFIGGFVAIAVLTRGAASSKCSDASTNILGQSGYGGRGFGTGRDQNVTYALNPAQNCRLEKACFAVAIINIILFIASALLQLALGRRNQRDKRYGPSPSNNYTSGSKKRFGFGRRKKAARDTEMATAARQSHDTGFTGSTVDPAYGGSANKYGAAPVAGGHTGPAVNGGYGNTGYTRPAHGQTNF